ncbi:MAG: phospho-N-acetylmuramoyl-pentapeptide-transferase [Candidatus Omnitrophota bacterium]|nr:phospho-N-acetylmuramoyl-pentapeptide-transferase [Candidatus Omnitrophota bacterium]MBU2528720.1 phospho-N-acetylmuramoyl-pentapeptide-transferase [bacterium]MBU3929389.1 phospho-N-acetylmuramoyl-pentapeptide-transferase [bacterium]MBU4123765.1 phospho-N-acetylmuramoyl-pentapeptide-transferase [bacterium]
MFYWLFVPLKEFFFGFNLFRYISFRALGGIITSFAFVVVAVPMWINYFKSKKLLMAVREDSLVNHHKKVTVPTMGGVILIPAIIINALLWMRLDCKFTYIVVGVLFILGLCGFMDDYKKIKRQSAKGLSAKTKLMFQAAAGIGLGIYMFFHPAFPEGQTAVSIPFFKNIILYTGVFYILFTSIIIVASSNAVNLTDGLDGLAIGSVILVSAAFAILAYIAGNIKFAGYLKFPYVPQAGEITIFLTIIIGAGLGFLWFNAPPAEIFMGDTGSLPLGGVIGAISVLIKQEALLIIAGGVFVVEALSVIIQVLYYKKTSRRFFKMAPLHHHFELKNWPESKVVVRFWIMGIFCIILALLTLKVR